RLDNVFAQAGLGTSSMRAPLQRTDDPEAEAARVGMLFRQVDEDGLVMSDMVGGYGVAESVLQAMVTLGLEPVATPAVLQGCVAMGGSTALYLHMAGVKVVGLVDARGLVVNTTRGLDVPKLMAHRQPGGVIDRSLLRLDDHELPSEDWLDVDTD